MSEDIKVIDCVGRWQPHDVTIVEVRIQHGQQVLDLTLDQARCLHQELGAHLAAIQAEEEA